MYYLIHTNHHPRPYLSTISFIANDFANWGCRVTSHANSSAYIAEIRYQEKRNRPGSRRIELMEVWAKEVLARKQRQPQPHAAGPSTVEQSARKERASAFAQDFVASLSLFDSLFIAPKPLPNDPLPLPAHPQALVARYTRLLYRCAHTCAAPVPPWANPAVTFTDQVSLEFRFERGLVRDQLSRALNEAIGKADGRMGRVEMCRETGVTKVLMWVDVGDLVGREKEDGGEVPVPVYERGGWVWPPVYEESEVC